MELELPRGWNSHNVSLEIYLCSRLGALNDTASLNKLDCGFELLVYWWMSIIVLLSCELFKFNASHLCFRNSMPNLFRTKDVVKLTSLILMNVLAGIFDSSKTAVVTPPYSLKVLLVLSRQSKTVATVTAKLCGKNSQFLPYLWKVFWSYCSEIKNEPMSAREISASETPTSSSLYFNQLRFGPIQRLSFAV